MPPNGKIYSTVDSYIFWKEVNLIVSVEWAGDLHPQLDGYIDRISKIRRNDRPNQSFNRDAQQQASPAVGVR